jgi:DNA-binding transcriptional LysR family regulator
MAGLGFGQLPGFVADQHIASGRLVPVLHKQQPEPWDIYVYRPQRGPVPARIRLVFDQLVAGLGGDSGKKVSQK